MAEEVQPAKLTRRQRVFVEFYLQTWNATESARLAGFKNPNKQGPRLLVKDGIQSAIAARMEALAMDANEVLTRLAEQARSSMGDFVERRLSEIPTKDGDIIQVEGLGLIWDAIKNKGHLVKKISQTANGYSIELHDAQAALVHIGRHLALFTDKTEVSGKNGGPVEIKMVEVVLPPEEPGDVHDDMLND